MHAEGTHTDKERRHLTRVGAVKELVVAGRIAIVGIGLEYPDASSPQDLWDNVLAGRRAFRDIPKDRTNLDDYWREDATSVDHFYSRKAAVLRDYEFDRLKHRVSTATFQATDMTHWLALDTCGRALADAGFPEGSGIPQGRSGVIIGNTLTGEFTRAQLMRLRWPYVKRTVASQLHTLDWSSSAIQEFTTELEARYKSSFPIPNEDSLAGGLANTIAGRVCNYFDLGGGGYTVDGACSSSLLAVTNAAGALAQGSLDVAIAGGVDLSLDPFELTGFARTGALSTSEMKVYDSGSNGFWPGEGCGMIVLMREDDAVSQGRRIYASISGWGVSSDGKGGMTRPEVSGHRRAIEQAYGQAGYPMDTVSYFEGHGTGTAVGDDTEIQALAGTREGSDRAPAAIGTIKGNIGHTKAAAGVAGLIKAVMAIYERTIPPITGHTDPHPRLIEHANSLIAPKQALAWPSDVPMRAGVSAMGFGGINTHIALEQADLADLKRPEPNASVAATVRGRQDTEVLLLGAKDIDELVVNISMARDRLTEASMCELADICATLTINHSDGPLRAAIAVRKPEDGARQLGRILERLTTVDSVDSVGRLESLGARTYLGYSRTEPRIGFVFPGQGAGSGLRGALLKRFPSSRTEEFSSGTDTAALQPRVVGRSLDVFDLLRRCGVTAEVAAGHSLGEITALTWAGAVDHDQAVRIAAERGSRMASSSPQNGAMAVLHADESSTSELINGYDATISGLNAPEITVIAGRSHDVEKVCSAAEMAQITANPLNVAHAFHTEDFRQASVELGSYLSTEAFQPVAGRLISTLSGEVMTGHEDLAAHLANQMVSPVRFVDAIQQMKDLDLVVEVGPGRALSGLVSTTIPEVTVTSTDSDSPSLTDFLDTIAAAHTAGSSIDTDALFKGRFVRPFDIAASPAFLANPCESEPSLDTANANPEADPSTVPEDESTLDALRRLIAEKVELPIEVVTADTLPLDELHLSSITVGQIINDAIKHLGGTALAGVPSFATATVGEIATMLEETIESEGVTEGSAAEVIGAASWVRTFAVRQQTVPAVPDVTTPGTSAWTYIGSGAPDTALLDSLSRVDGAPGLLIDARSATEDDLIVMLTSAFERVRGAVDDETALRVVVLHHPGHDLAASVKSLHLEHAQTLTTTVVSVPDDEGFPVAPTVQAEVAYTTAFNEVAYDEGGHRTKSNLVAVTSDATDVPLSHGDVLLATGGAKGITAEACLEIGRRFHSAVALVGRADNSDVAVTATLERLKDAGVECHYVQADVMDPESLTLAIGELQDRLGTITALLHGAGLNEPKAALDLTEEDLRQTLDPKLFGFRNVFSALDPGAMKLLIGFGSIIGRAGLYGEAHYALANSWLSEDLEKLAVEHPNIRVRSLEWSVWSGAGMGERLGVVERLKQQGIEPIGLDDGLQALSEAITTPGYPTTVVICSRTGRLPTLSFAAREIPLTRYLEREVLHYPAVELVTEARLSARNDPYLLNHVFDDNVLFPAVMGLEAMAEAAEGVQELSRYLSMTRVAFEQPIIVDPDEGETVRVCAVADATDTIRLSIRTQATGFVADHFRATLTSSSSSPTTLPASTPSSSDRLEPILLRPLEDLYGGVMFQGDHFQKIGSYRQVTAREVTVDLDSTPRDDWYATHLPKGFLLGDPGARDALMHALQCCVPNATLLPHSVERIDIDTASTAGRLVMSAREREGDGEWFVYDITVRDEEGATVESWKGLRLRAVARTRSQEMSWPLSFLGPYLERECEVQLGGSRSVVVEPHGSTTRLPADHARAATATAVARSGWTRAIPTYRADGRPQLTEGLQLSSSHSGGFTVTTVSRERTAVDAERVISRSAEEWHGLLGEHGAAVCEALVGQTNLSYDDAATRVWCALECLRKSGLIKTSVQLGAVSEDGWIRFRSGPFSIASWSGSTLTGHHVSVAVLAEES